MVKRPNFRRSALFAALFGFVSAAYAHPGHDHADIPSLIRHPFAGPEHLVGSAALGLALAGMVYFATRRVAMPAVVRWSGLALVAVAVTLVAPV